MKGLDEADVIPCRHIQLAQLEPVQTYRDENHRKQHQQDAGLFRAFLRDIPTDQVHYAKGSTMGVTYEGVFYSVMFDHDLLLGEGRQGCSLQVVEPLEAEVADVVRYRLLGHLIDTGNGFNCMAAKEKIALYLLKFDVKTPHSPLFNELMMHLLASRQSCFDTEKSLLYPKGSVFYLKINGEYTELYLKSNNALHIRLSTSKKHSNELCIDMMAPTALGRGTFGAVFKASTYHLMKACLVPGKQARVVKVIPRYQYKDKSFEPEDDFEARVRHEAHFSHLFGLKSKPVMIDHSKEVAHLVMREVPGATMKAWLACWREARTDGYLIGVEFAYRVALACLEALMDLHAQNIIHGDLKTNNLMMNVIDGEVSAKCVDAGSACYVDQADVFAANPKYACPESRPSLAGQPGYVALNTQEADVYALGIVLAKMFNLGMNADSVSKRCFGVVLDGLLHPDPALRYTVKRGHAELLSFFNTKVVGPEVSALGSKEQARRHVK